jgi:hypothetical protein
VSEEERALLLRWADYACLLKDLDLAEKVYTRYDDSAGKALAAQIRAGASVRLAPQRCSSGCKPFSIHLFYEGSEYRCPLTLACCNSGAATSDVYLCRVCFRSLRFDVHLFVVSLLAANGCSGATHQRVVCPFCAVEMRRASAVELSMVYDDSLAAALVKPPDVVTVQL